MRNHLGRKKQSGTSSCDHMFCWSYATIVGWNSCSATDTVNTFRAGICGPPYPVLENLCTGGVIRIIYCSVIKHHNASTFPSGRGTSTLWSLKCTGILHRCCTRFLCNVLLVPGTWYDGTRYSTRVPGRPLITLSTWMYCTYKKQELVL